jgi:hypothetical protein
LSASTTTVDGGTDKGKNIKHKETELPQSQVYDADKKPEDCDATPTETGDDESVGVVTRGRARGKAVEKAPGPAPIGRSKATNGPTNPRRRPKRIKS